MRNLIAAMAVGVILSGCSSLDSGKAGIKEDPWYKAYPRWMDHNANDINTYLHIPRSLISPVCDAYRQEAIARLEHAECIEIDMKQAIQYANQAWAPDALLEAAALAANEEAEQDLRTAQDPRSSGIADSFRHAADDARRAEAVAKELKGKLKPYLVRALVLREGQSTYSASLSETDLLVHNSCMGHSVSSMRRRPIVVFLPQRPDTVYITVSMVD